LKWRTLGFALTVGAVILLVGSAIWGLRDDSGGLDPRLTASQGLRTVRQDRIRVEVLNATGITGLAREVTERLRNEGFDIVYYGNASGTTARDSTTLIDRSGNAAAIEALTKALPAARLESAIDTTLYLEATLVVGPDWPMEGSKPE
jgi:hypothetical protein